MKIAKEPIIFVAGLAIGSLATFFGVKGYYKNLADEEIESVKEAFKSEKKAEEVKDDKTNSVPSPDTKGVSTVAKSSLDGTNLQKYQKLVRDYGGAVKRKEIVPDPYVINPDEYADGKPGYSQEVLIYYDEDQVLATEGDEVVCPEKYVGTEWKNNFGRYEKDIVHIRNEAITTDYEIQCVYSSYEAATGGYYAREEDS